MAIYITNDLHGSSYLVQNVVDAIGNMSESDTLIINGDGSGARGPIMNNLVKVFYEVRRGETEYEELIGIIAGIIDEDPDFPRSWVFDSVHAGVFRAVLAKRYKKFKKCVEKELFDVIEETLCPLASAANAAGVKILYVPGNGEIVPSDFATDDITVEKTLPPEERFYQETARRGYFEQMGIKYVPYVDTITHFSDKALPSRLVVMSANLLDLPTDEALALMSDCDLLIGEGPSKVIVHYPPAIGWVGKRFDFWNPNKVDIARINALQKLLGALQLENATVFFGHVHLSIGDSRMDAYPPTIGFGYERQDYDGLWIKPGEVIKIKW